MKKVKLFVCRFGGKTFTIYAIPHNRIAGRLEYLTYVGRKRLDLFTWETFEGAVGSVLCEIPEFELERFKACWL